MRRGRARARSVLAGKHTYAAVFSHCAGPRAGPVLDAMLFTFGMGSCIGRLAAPHLRSDHAEHRWLELSMLSFCP